MFVEKNSESFFAIFWFVFFYFNFTLIIVLCSIKFKLKLINRFVIIEFNFFFASITEVIKFLFLKEVIQFRPQSGLLLILYL